MAELYTKKAIHCQKNLFLIILILCMILTGSLHAQTIRYVKQGATGNGSSWANASGDIQEMINASSEGDQVWIAKGIYLPTRKPGENTITPNDRDNTFYLKSEVSVYGSFAGNETMITQRSYIDNPTVLSGDFNGDDADVPATMLGNTSAAKNGDNAYHVVIARGLHPFTVFDGFQIQGGNANGTGVYTMPDTSYIPRGTGAGIFSENSSEKLSNIAVRSCNALTGGGIYKFLSFAEIFNIKIAKCRSVRGGGLYLKGEISFFNLLIVNCTATYGDAIYADSGSLVRFTNATLSGNGGGLGLISVNGTTHMTLSNSIISGNTSPSHFSGGYPATVFLRHNLLEGGATASNGLTINNQFGNINGTPTFVNSSVGDFRLQTGSLGIDTGSNSENNFPIDLAGNARIYGSKIDMGAFEFNPTCSPPAAPATQYICEDGTVSDLTATGTNIKWYASAAGGQVLSPSHTVAYGTYYASQTVNGCESSRVAVTVYIMYKPQITLYYTAEPVPLVNNSIERWYSAPEGGTPLPDGTLLVQGNYYVSGYTENCETDRVARYVLLTPPVTYYADNDLDGFGNPEVTITAINPPTQYYSLVAGDCDDNDPEVGNCNDIPFTKLEGQYCAAFLPSLFTQIYAEAVEGADSYRFWVTDYNMDEVVEKPVRSFKLSELSSYSYSHTYNVRVSARINGEWTPYGVTCPVITQASPITKVRASQCGVTVSSMTTPIYADAVPSAGSYRFRITRNGASVVLTKTAPFFRFNEVEGVVYGAAYTVEVAVQLYGSWSFYGSPCTLSTPDVPATKVTAEQCGNAVSSFTTNIYADAYPPAAAYRFRIAEGTNVQVIEKPARYLAFNEIAGHTYGKTYSIAVAVQAGGAWHPYGQACNVSAPAIPQPSVKPGICGTTVEFTSQLQAETVQFAQMYRFRVSIGSEEQAVLDRAVPYIRLNELSTYSYATTYTVEVSVMIDGGWSAYGTPCTVTTPALGSTRLKDAHCGGTVSSLSAKIYAQSVSNVTGYRFRITNGGNTQVLTRPGNMFQLNMVAGAAFFVTYSVEVAVQSGGSWGAYGPVCNVTAIWPGLSSRPGAEGYAVTTDAEMAGEEQAENEILAQAVTLSAYPNPYADAFTVEMDTQSTGKVTVRAFDMNGRLVEDITVAAEELATQKLGSRLMSGIYNVVVTQGSYTKSFRVVKK